MSPPRRRVDPGALTDVYRRVEAVAGRTQVDVAEVNGDHYLRVYVPCQSKADAHAVYDALTETDGGGA